MIEGLAPVWWGAGAGWGLFVGDLACMYTWSDAGCADGCALISYISIFVHVMFFIVNNIGCSFL